MNEKPIITTGQLFTLFFVSRLSLVLLYAADLSGKASLWELLLPLLISLPLMLLLLAPLFVVEKHGNTHSFFPSQGTKTGQVLPVCYALYFAGSAVYGLASLFSFMQAVIPEGLEPKLILILLLCGCTYAAVKGIEASARMSAVVLLLLGVSVLLSLVFLMPGFQVQNFLPLQGMTVLTVTDGVIFLVSRMNALTTLTILSPHLKGDINRGCRLFVSLSVLFFVFLLLLLQGTSGSYLSSRSFQVFAGLEASGNLQRLHPVFILVIVCSSFCHVSLHLLSAAECLRAAFPKTSVKKHSIRCAIVLLTVILFLSDGLTSVFCNRYLWAGLNVLFLTFIPLTVWLFRKTTARGRRLAFQGAASIVIIAVMLSLFSGCGSIQLNQRVIVQGVGIDKTENAYKLTLITLNTENADRENTPILLFSEGTTPQEAVISLENRTGKRTLFSSCLFLMMNRSAAESCDQTLSYFAGLSELRTSTNLMTSADTAETTICMALEEFGYRAEEINMLTDSKAIGQPVTHCSMMEYLSADRPLQMPLVAINRPLHTLQIDALKPTIKIREQPSPTMFVKSEF